MGSVPQNAIKYSYLAGSTGSHLIENCPKIGGIKRNAIPVLVSKLLGTQKQLKVLKREPLEINIYIRPFVYALRNTKPWLYINSTEVQESGGIYFQHFSPRKFRK